MMGNIESKPKLPPNFSDPTELVTIIVAERKFEAHKSLITYHSPYFDRAFNGSFIEAAKNGVTLEDVSKTTFATFVHWLYTQKVYRSGVEGIIPAAHEMCELWVLADYLLIPRLQNQMMRELDRSWNLQTVTQDEMQLVVGAAFASSLESKLQQRVLQRLVRMSKEYSRPIHEWVEWFPDSLKDAFIRAMLQHYNGRDRVFEMPLNAFFVFEDRGGFPASY